MRTSRLLSTALLCAVFSLFCGQASATAAFGISNWAHTKSTMLGNPIETWDFQNGSCVNNTNECTAASYYASASDNIQIGSASGRVNATSAADGFGIGAHVNAYWWDTITITSPTLIDGSLVTVNGSVALRASTFPSQGVPAPWTKAEAY